MIDKAASWISQNQFLVAQAIASAAAAISLVVYVTTLENRLATLEIRGSPHLTVIDNRLTVLESTTKDNKDRLQKIVDVMTKELHISPTRDK